MKNLLLTTLFMSPLLLLAQGSQVNTQSQKAVGMAGAGSALFIDETSIFYNPGALAKMNGNSIQIGGNAIMYRSAFREFGSNDTHNSKFQISPPFSLFATIGPKNSWWKAGVGVYTPFGGSVDWGSDWPGKFSLNKLSLRAIFIQPTLSFRITDKFSVGGGFVYNFGQVDLTRSIPVYFGDGRTGQAELSGTGTGMGYNVGIHYKLENEVAISLSYRSKVITKLDNGDARFDVPSSIAARFPNTTFKSELPLPSSFNLGVAVPLSKRFDLAIDGTIINYSVYKELVFNYAHNVNREADSRKVEDTRSTKNYQNAFSVKAGIQYKAHDKLDLRVGGGYVLTPVVNGYVYPETPDNNRLMGSAGFTYAMSPKWELTGSYVFQHIQPRTSTNIESRLNGTYETYIHAPGLSLTYKW